MKKFVSLLLAFLMVVALSGCTAKHNDSDAAEIEISAYGSTSMHSVILAMNAEYKRICDDVEITYNPIGSAAGIAAVRDGKCDIGLSSRSLKPDEKAEGLKETVIALDGISVIVNKANFISDLTVEQIADIYIGKITNWKDVGGADAEIALIGRESGSGTRDGFESVTKTSDNCKYRKELDSTEAVVEEVSKNPNAIGYASLTAVGDDVKTLRVDGVMPNEESVKNGSYKIQRPFVFVIMSGAELSESVEDFFNWAVSSKASDAIESAGAIPIK